MKLFSETCQWYRHFLIVKSALRKSVIPKLNGSKHIVGLMPTYDGVYIVRCMVRNYNIKSVDLILGEGIYLVESEDFCVTRTKKIIDFKCGASWTLEDFVSHLIRDDVTIWKGLLNHLTLCTRNSLVSGIWAIRIQDHSSQQFTFRNRHNFNNSVVMEGNKYCDNLWFLNHLAGIPIFRCHLRSKTRNGRKYGPLWFFVD